VPPQSVSFKFVGGDPRRNVVKIEDAVISGVYDGVTSIGEFVKARAQQNVTDLSKVDRGTLRASITSEVSSDTKGITASIFPTVAYGVWVEFGRLGALSSPAGTGKDSAKSAFPPVQVIRDWVLRNRVKLAVASGDINSVAFLIARKIFRYGIEPKPFMRPAFDLGATHFERVVKDNVDKQVRSFKKVKR